MRSIMRRPPRVGPGPDRNASRDRRRRRGRRQSPLLERLDARLLLAVDITSFNITAGTVTFSGDQNGTTDDNLTLSEVTVDVGGSTETLLAHDLVGNGGTGDYADATDMDPGPGVAHIVIGTGTAPTITVSLGDGNDSMTLDSSWTFTEPLSYDGGAGTNSLATTDGTNTWTLTGTRAGNINGAGVLDFSSVDSLQGGAGTEALVGEDVDSTWSFGTSQTYNDGSAPVTFAGFSTVQGGSGIDTFDLTGDGFLDMVVASLNGGVGDDVFNFSGDTVLIGNLDGQSGTDTLNDSGYGSPLNVILSGSSADGYSGTETTSISGTFSGIDVLTGTSSGSDFLTGEDVAGTWTLGASQTYQDTNSSSPLGFSGFGTLQGGLDNDTFLVTDNTATNLLGGAGDDSFVVSDAMALTGTVDGQTGQDSLDLSAYSTTVAVVLTGSDSTGFNGTGTGTDGFSGISSINSGSASTDSLTGEDVAGTWTLSANPSYDDGSASLPLSGFEILQGGSAADVFNVSAAITATLKGGDGDDTFAVLDGGALTGSLDGETGLNTLTYAGNTAPVTVSLVSSSTNGFAGSTSGASGGFAGILTLIGGSSTDTLTGEDIDSTWSLDTAQTYSDGVGMLDFSAFEVLQGGMAVDTFQVMADTTASLKGGGDNDIFQFLADGAYLTGTIDGEVGYNTLDYSSLTGPVSVNLAARSASAMRGFSNIQNLAGSSGGGTLVGANVANTWTISDSDMGTVSGLLGDMDFFGIGNLTGGTSTDSFSFAAGSGLSGTLNGGAGTDYLSFAAFSTDLAVNISANNGGSVTGSGLGLNFSGIESLTGGSGNDTFAFAVGRSVTGTLNGGGGTDTLDYSAYTTSVRVNLAAGAALGVKYGVSGGVSAVENVTGGSGNDILIGDSANNVLDGGGGNDSLVGNGGDDTLTGGVGSDILIGGVGADSLDGGTGDDLLVGERTSYDNNLAALNSLMAEWGRTDITYATKIAHLDGSLSGGRNRSFVLNDTTVFSDTGSVDSLTGGDGVDWFVTFVEDLITDLNSGGSETRKTLL